MSNDPFDKWANEESDMGDSFVFDETRAAEVVRVTDKNRDAITEIVRLQFSGQFVGKCCPYCGKAYDTSDDVMLAKIWSGTHEMPTHGECYYQHEADNIWRAKHPEYAPK